MLLFSYHKTVAWLETERFTCLISSSKCLKHCNFGEKGLWIHKGITLKNKISVRRVFQVVYELENYALI